MTDGPAVEFAIIDGGRQWYVNGQLHRVDQATDGISMTNCIAKMGLRMGQWQSVPAIETTHGSQKDGPAIELVLDSMAKKCLQIRTCPGCITARNGDLLL